MDVTLFLVSGGCNEFAGGRAYMNRPILPPRRHRRRDAAPAARLCIVGAVFSFFSPLLGSVGPIMIPFFLAYGLVKGALIGTEALATVVMHVTKLVAYGSTAILTSHSVTGGLGLGFIMILGSLIGKKILDRLPEQIFIFLIEGTLLIAGLRFVIY